jgi:DNA-binding MarR family transcriptional regulator
MSKGVTANQLRILKWLAENGIQTPTELGKALYGAMFRSRNTSWAVKNMNALAAKGLIIRHGVTRREVYYGISFDGAKLVKHS